MLGFSGTISGNEISVVDAAVRDLVSVRDVGISRFVSLPLLYPDGSNVTVELRRVENGFLVSDSGFAYREAECIGGERSFGRLAKGVAELVGVDVMNRTISIQSSLDDLYRAICDVSTVSWRVADEISARITEQDEAELVDELRMRLKRVFGEAKVEEKKLIVGASTGEWEVSAVVHGGHGPVAFQSVGNHANSVFRTVTAFGDIANTDHPPVLVAVVRSKIELGKRLALLARDGRVIEASQADDIYWKVAA